MATNLRDEIRDQILHTVIAVIIPLVAMTFPPMIGCPLAAFMIGAVREQGQHKGFKWGRGSWLDLLFWTLGGLITGALVTFV